MDNYATHKTKLNRDWFAKRPLWHVHFTPTSASWLNQVERFFAKITEKQLQPGIHRSTADLEAAILHYVETVNSDPRPFRWTKSADDILAEIQRFCLPTQHSGGIAESGHERPVDRAKEVRIRLARLHHEPGCPPMADELFVDAHSAALLDEAGRTFDAWHWRWDAAPPCTGARTPIGPVAALGHLARTARCRRVPVGVIGPREPSPQQRTTAEHLGEVLAGMGLAVLCGGKGGVMEAVARGVDRKGGLCIGLLPEDDWRGANPFVTVPLATGIGKARNVLIAQASSALVAIGGQYGTLSEIAFGLHFDKPVFGLDGVPEVPGLRRMQTVEAVAEALARHLLHLPDPSSSRHEQAASERLEGGRG